MRTITLEEHMSTPAFLEATTAHSLRSGNDEFIRKVRAKLVDLDQGRTADMDAAHIDLQVLSLAGGEMDRLDSSTATSLARDTNEALATAVRSHPDRFAAFATVNLQEPETAARELERCIRELRFVGVMVNGTTRGLFLDDPTFTPFWEAAASLDIPVYLHPAPPPAPVQQAYFSGLPEDL